MGYVTGFLVYVVVWWLIFFMTLPWGVKPATSPEPGTEPGAPETPHLWLKVGLTTLISSLLFLFLYLFVPSDLLQWSYFKE